MAAPKRSRSQRQADMVRLSDMYLSGMQKQEIAKELGVSGAQITYDLKKLHEEWRESSLFNLNEAKGKELARLELVMREAFQGWRRSQVDAEGKEEVSGETAKGIIETLKTWKKGQAGDPRFLNVVLDCVKQIRAIKGLDQPVQMHHTMSRPSPEMEAIANLTDTELEELERSLIADGPAPKVSTVH